MAVVVQMRILEQEQAFAGTELPSTVFDEKEPEEEDSATDGALCFISAGAKRTGDADLCGPADMH